MVGRKGAVEETGDGERERPATGRGRGRRRCERAVRERERKREWCELCERERGRGSGVRWSERLVEGYIWKLTKICNVPEVALRTLKRHIIRNGGSRRVTHTHTREREGERMFTIFGMLIKI